MINNIVFDIGGVLAFDVWEHLLLDPEEGAAARFGLDSGEVERYGPELWKVFEHRPLENGETADMLEIGYWKHFIRKFNLTEPLETFIDMTDRFIRPVEGMTELLRKLKTSGINLAICSNNNEFWMRKQMNKVGLHSYFEPEKVICSSRVGASKISPDFEMFKAVADVLGADSTSVVFIEDRFENIERAMEYGWAGILFPQASPYGASYLESLFSRMGVL